MNKCRGCGDPVLRAGETCSPDCYAHAWQRLKDRADTQGLVSLGPGESLLPAEMQPWYEPTVLGMGPEAYRRTLEDKVG